MEQGKTITAYLAPIYQQLQQTSCTLHQIWMDHTTTWHHLGWTQSQLRLWLRCQPDIHIDVTDTINPTYQVGTVNSSSAPSLADHLMPLLDSAGKPMPMSQLMNKLPVGMLVTEPMLRAAINADSRLQLIGPLVKLA
jgi:hypothetical protein